MKKAIVLFLIATAMLTGCATTKVTRPDEPISLVKALEEIMKALDELAKVETEKIHGLVPAEITVTFSITAGKKKDAGVSVEIVPTGIISEIPTIGGSYSTEVSESTGNQIVIKFRNIIFANEKELISKKEPKEIHEIFKQLRDLGWFIKRN